MDDEKKPPCFKQEIHPLTFSIFGRANTNVAANSTQVQDIKETDSERGACMVSTLGILRSIFRM